MADSIYDPSTPASSSYPGTIYLPGGGQYTPDDVSQGMAQAAVGAPGTIGGVDTAATQGATGVQALEDAAGGLAGTGSQVASQAANTGGLLSRLAGAGSGAASGLKATGSGLLNDPLATAGGLVSKFAPLGLAAYGGEQLLTGNKQSGAEYLGAGLGSMATKSAQAAATRALSSAGEEGGGFLADLFGTAAAGEGAEAGAEVGTLGGPLGTILGGVAGGALGYLLGHVLKLKNKPAAGSSSSAAANASSTPLGTTNLTPEQETFLSNTYNEQATAERNAVQQLIASMDPTTKGTFGVEAESLEGLEDTFLQAMAADPEAILRGAQTTLGGTSLTQSLVNAAIAQSQTPQPTSASSTVPGTTG